MRKRSRLLIERITVSADGLAVDLRTEGLGSVIREMVTPNGDKQHERRIHPVKAAGVLLSCFLV